MNYKSKVPRIVLLVILAATFSIPGPASAAPSQIPLAITSPTQCDSNSPPKYSCAYITYSIYSSGGVNWYRVDNRYFKGARDGGAQQWQIEYYDDYRWNGSAWVLSYASGSTGWWTNISMPGSYSSLGPPNAQAGGAYSTVRFRYFEVTPDRPLGYHWLSGPFTFFVT